MPNVDGFLRFQQGMISVEDRYKTRIRGAFQRSRTRLVQITADLGLESPFLVATLSAEFNRLGAETEEIARDYEPVVVGRTAGWAEVQLADARSVGVSAPTLAELGDPQSIISMSSGSADIFQGRVISTIPRLQGEELERALGMLYYPDEYDGRVSIYKASENTAMIDAGIAIWGLSNSYLNDIFGMLATTQPLQKWKRQAIAAVDMRTTECCLWVHGQIVEENEPFTLVAEPKFNDEQMNAPFHWNCRTGTSLYLEAFEGIGVTTDDMEGAAHDELIARAETGRRVEIHPSHATSGR